MGVAKNRSCEIGRGLNGKRLNASGHLHHDVTLDVAVSKQSHESQHFDVVSVDVEEKMFNRFWYLLIGKGQQGHK